MHKMHLQLAMIFTSTIDLCDKLRKLSVDLAFNFAPVECGPPVMHELSDFLARVLAHQINSKQDCRETYLFRSPV